MGEILQTKEYIHLYLFLQYSSTFNHITIMAVINKFPLIQTVWRQCLKSGGFDSNFKKIKLISGGEGKCEAEFTVDKEHTNFMGLLYDNLIFPPCDSCK